MVGVVCPALPRIAQTLHTAPLRPFWSCRRLQYLSHCWLIWKHDTHLQLNPVYTVESLSTYWRWLRSSQLDESELFMWPRNSYRKGKRSGGGPWDQRKSALVTAHLSLRQNQCHLLWDQNWGGGLVIWALVQVPSHALCDKSDLSFLGLSFFICKVNRV